MAIRLLRSDDQISVVRTSQSGTSVEHFAPSPLTNSQWQMFETSLKDLNLWLLPTLRLPGPGNNPVLLHANGWGLEGRSGGMYHVAVRSSGQLEPAFIRVSRMFFTLAGLDIPEELNLKSEERR
jgi:hypothetical protein